MASVCGTCHKDLRSQHTEDDAVEVLESIDTTEPTVECPQCGGSNFLGTESCYLCNARLHPLLSERAPQQYPAAPPLSPATAAKLTLGLAATVVALLIGVIVIVNAGVKAFSDQPVEAQDRQEYVVASRLAPNTSGDPAAPPQVIEEQVSAEPSALERYKAERAKHPEKYKSSAKQPAKSPTKTITEPVSSANAISSPAKYTGNYVLPLPSGGKFHTDRHKTGKKYVTGVARYSVNRNLGDVWEIYDLSKLLVPCFKQDLWPNSSVREGRGDDVSQFEVRITVDGYKDCSIRIGLTPSDVSSKTRTDILLTYTIPKGRTIRLSTTANGK